MSHPDDTGDSALGRVARSLRRRRTTPSAPDESAAQSGTTTPAEPTESAEDTTVSDAHDVAEPDETPEETAEPAAADEGPDADVVDDAETPEEASAEAAVADDTEAGDTESDDPEAETDPVGDEAAPAEQPADDEAVDEAAQDETAAVDEPDGEPSTEQPAETEASDDGDESEAPEPPAAEAKTTTEPETAPEPGSEAAPEPEPESAAEPEPESATDPEPQPAPRRAEPERITPAVETDKAAPQYIPPVTAGAGPRPDAGQNRRKLLVWASSVAAIIVAVVVVVVAVLASRGSPAVPQADQAADVAQKYATALSNGDLTTLRDVTCGDRKQFYDSTDPQAFAAQYQAQKDAGRLVEVRGVKAARVVDPTNAIVEVSAALTGAPDKTSDVVLRLESQDGTWKVCSSSAGSQPAG